MKLALTVLMMIGIPCHALAQQTNIENITANTFHSTIQAAVDSSQHGDTIVLCPGTYYESTSFNGKNILITSPFIYNGDTSYIDSTIIDPSNLGYAFRFTNGEDSTATVSGLTISGNSSSLDTACCSAFKFYYSSGMVRHIKITGFDASSSCHGASKIIRLDYSTVTMNNIFLSVGWNEVKHILEADHSNLILTNITCIDSQRAFAFCTNGNIDVLNSSFHGVGRYALFTFSNMDVLIDSCIFVNCRANYANSIIQGSEIYPIEIRNTHITGSPDGIIDIDDSEVILDNVQIVKNYASYYCVVLTNVDFSANKLLLKDNRTHELPYALTLANCNSRIVNSTIIGNSGWWTNAEAGIFTSSAGSNYFVNCIIDGNHAIGAMDCPKPTEYNLYAGPNTFLSHCFVNRVFTDPSYLSGNIFEEDPEFGHIWSQINYTGAMGHGIHPDAKLRYGSPCIDAGSNIVVHGGDTILQMDSTEYTGSSPDIGYQEFNFNPNQFCDLSINNLKFKDADQSLFILSDSLQFEVYNAGSQTINNATLHYSVNSGLVYPLVVGCSLPPGFATTIWTIVPMVNMPAQEYQIKAWINHPLDGNANNDTTAATLISGSSVENIPYYENFETGEAGWIDGGQNSDWIYTQGLLGSNYYYTQGLLDSVNSFHWVSSATTSNMCEHVRAWIKSPYFIVDTADFLKLSFELFISDGYENHALALQARFDNDENWITAGKQSQPQNWYDGIEENLEFFGDDNCGWLILPYSSSPPAVIQQCLNYLSVPPGSQKVQFRFIYYREGSYGNGFYFDNFSVEQVTTSIHEIPIQQGWNMISSYVIPHTPDIEILTSQISSSLIMLKDDNGQVYWPQFAFDQIKEWNFINGYYLKSTSQDTLVVYGHQLDPLVSTITVPEGWSLLPYFRKNSLPISLALSDLTGSIIIMKNSDGQVYWPQYGVQLFDDMVPGLAYLIKLNQSETLTYPMN
jgi:hypothetical protein